jgi:hypothetical protein
VATRIQRPPYEAYEGIVGTFAAGLATVGALARLLGREPQEHTALDFVTLAGATFKASRTLTRDQVASFIREPFVDEGEEPAGEGLRLAIGELVTCTRCAGTWVAAGLMSAQVLAPRFGRILTWSLAAAAANDWLQAGFTALTKRA